MDKLDYKDHPVIIISSCVGVAVAFCLTMFIPLHNLVVERKDGTIETERARISTLKEENELLRRRLQGDVLLVSTTDLQNVHTQVEEIEGNLSAQLRSITDSLSQLDEMKTQLDKSASQIPPQSYAQLRRIANIRPNGANVNWIGDRRSGTGMVTVSPSPLSKDLNSAFDKLNKRETEAASQILAKIISTEPTWPYVYFYRGLNQVNAGETGLDSFHESARRFQSLRDAGFLEPELLLFEAMTRTFTSDYDICQDLLDQLKEFNDNADQITILAVARNTPKKIQERFSAIAEKHKLKIVQLDVKIK